MFSVSSFANSFFFKNFVSFRKQSWVGVLQTNNLSARNWNIWLITSAAVCNQKKMFYLLFIWLFTHVYMLETEVTTNQVCSLLTCFLTDKDQPQFLNGFQLNKKKKPLSRQKIFLSSVSVPWLLAALNERGRKLIEHRRQKVNLDKVKSIAIRLVLLTACRQDWLSDHQCWMWWNAGTKIVDGLASCFDWPTLQTR